MLFERFEVKGLAHYSYAVGCGDGKLLAIVDPKRDVDEYLQYAEGLACRITHVFETHIHADYASGARELAQRAGATLCVSKYDAGETFEVSHPHHDLADGQTVELGEVRIRALHTPGHTPEHLSFLIFDDAQPADEPVAMLSGDFLFVGSLGRPDLLGEHAKLKLAESLYDSVRARLAGLPDGLPVYPGHGAGSMCGAGMSKRPHTTLGDERAGNPYFAPALTREMFIDRILSNVPPFPPYYRRMKKLNADGAPPIASLPAVEPIDAASFRAALDTGHVVIDLRHHLEFGAGHIPGAFGIGAGPMLSTWAAWVVPYETPILLVADDESLIAEATRCLRRVGLDDVRGHLAGAMAAWSHAGFDTTELPQWPPAELSRRLASGEAPHVLDVRSCAEFSSAHIDGALHIMGGELAQRVDELPRDGRPIAVICGGGYRSTVAASMLERAGFKGLLNVPGGMGAWIREGLPNAVSTNA
jgi:hydroxyacylglutathione hydrolase